MALAPIDRSYFEGNEVAVKSELLGLKREGVHSTAVGAPIPPQVFASAQASSDRLATISLEDFGNAVKGVNTEQQPTKTTRPTGEFASKVPSKSTGWTMS